MTVLRSNGHPTSLSAYPSDLDKDAFIAQYAERFPEPPLVPASPRRPKSPTDYQRGWIDANAYRDYRVAHGLACDRGERTGVALEPDQWRKEGRP